MTYCLVADNKSGTAEIYDQVVQKVRESGEFPPAGAIFQVAGPFEGGWRVISVWESREAQERFRDERLIPAWQEVGVNREDLSWSDFDAHNIIAGDLSGAITA
jgi:hypothetical protein